MTSPTTDHTLRNWLLLALSTSVRRRALLTAALIGTLLALINHGSELISGQMTRAQWLRVALTYLVPYCVATWSSVQTMRQLQAVNSKVSRASGSTRGCETMENS
jgi:hypothetical protein